MTRFSVSPISQQASQRRPGTKILCSSTTNWSSLLVQTHEQPGFVDHYETLASPDCLIVVVERGRYDIESLSSGKWKKAVYRPGIAGITAPLTTNRLRWHSSFKEEVRVIRTYLPLQYLDEASEEFRKAGSKRRLRCENILAFSDPVVTTTIQSSARAVQAGAPDIYAETAARFLATHLVSRGHGYDEAKLLWGRSGELTDERLRRTLEYMAWKFTEDLTVEQLAKEAGVSRFHFCRLFKMQVGITPHQHLSRLRMSQAKDLLSTTERRVADIVSACGFIHAGHFAAAFFRATGQTPSQYRRSAGKKDKG